MVVFLDGRTGTKTDYKVIRVTEPAGPVSTPVADFTGEPTAGQAPLTVQFTEISSPAPYHRWWQFGDGFNSTDANPVHVYDRTGAYTVNLTVWTPIGQATVSKPAHVIVDSDHRVPEANFTISRISGPGPLYVRLTDLSIGSPTSVTPRPCRAVSRASPATGRRANALPFPDGRPDSGRLACRVSLPGRSDRGNSRVTFS